MAENEANLVKASVVAERLGVSAHTINRKAKQGELPSHRVGKSYRFNLREVLEFTKTKPKGEN